MNKKTIQAIFITLFLTFMTLVVITNAQTGGGYDLTWSTIDGGGGSSSGGSFLLNGSIGQPDAGALSGGDYNLQGGFWHSNCVPPAVVTPTIALLNNDVELSWSLVNNAVSYNIYRDNDPYFVGTAVYANTTTSLWPDPGAAGNPAANHYYLIRAVGCNESGNSQRMGVFNFALVPGS